MSIESHGIDWYPDHSTKDTDKWIDKSFLGNPLQRFIYNTEVKTAKIINKIKTSKLAKNNP